MLSSQITSNGSVPVYSANMFEPFGYTEEMLLTDFSQPSVVWGIDGDWQVNLIPENQPFYPTDHCGVMRIKSGDIHPRYMVWALEKAGQELKFSRSYRASLDRIESITIPLPPKKEMMEAMEEVLSIERKIKDLMNVLDTFEQQKRTIVDSFLN